jgi:uncharacterized protein YjaZ
MLNGGSIMSKLTNLSFTPESFQNLQFELIVDLYSKISTLESFIVEYLTEHKPEQYETEKLVNWFTETTNTNKLNLIAEITRKHSL